MHQTASPSGKFAAALFDRHGLGSPGLWGANVIPGGESPVDGASALCEALAQLGGLYAAFARFLNWRADVLAAAYISRLSSVRLKFPGVPRSTVVATIRRELGARAEELADAVSIEPLWTTWSRTAYLSRFQNRMVIVQVAHKPVSEKSIEEFEKGIRSIGSRELGAVVTDSVLQQFREWIRNGESLARERAFLEVLGNHRGETLVEYPALVPTLCAPSILCWHAVEGRPVSGLIEQGDPGATVLIASAILEQFFSLSMVDADLDLDSMIVDHENRLHVVRLHNPLDVLPGLINTGIKYAAAVVAGDAARSAQTLIRLLISQPPLDLEKELMEEFSGIEPELKINRWFPASAATFESNWRALAKMAPSRPLFLDCLHRNLLAAGYWNSDAERAGAPASDAIAEAMWPVVGHLIRNQFGVLLTRETAAEWVAGSGLVFMGALREMNRLVEETRENDITIGVDYIERPGSNRTERRLLPQLFLAGLVVLFLLVLQWGGAAPEPWSLVLKVLAICAIPAMFWAISRI